MPLSFRCLLSVSACIIVVAACRSAPDPIVAEPLTASVVSDAGASAPVGTACAKPIKRLQHALAIPQGQTGTIEIVLTNHPASCRYWTDPEYRNGCDVWRARIHLDASLQQPGRYALHDGPLRFGYLDRKATTSGGAWLDGGVCKNVGGDLRGELEVLAMTQDRIDGRICGSGAGADARSDGLLDGTFTATRCPACQMTGEPCQSNDECCTSFCSGGRCRP